MFSALTRTHGVPILILFAITVHQVVGISSGVTCPNDLYLADTSCVSTCPVNTLPYPIITSITSGTCSSDNSQEVSPGQCGGIHAGQYFSPIPTVQCVGGPTQCPAGTTPMVTATYSNQCIPNCATNELFNMIWGFPSCALGLNTQGEAIGSCGTNSDWYIYQGQVCVDTCPLYTIPNPDTTQNNCVYQCGTNEVRVPGEAVPSCYIAAMSTIVGGCPVYEYNGGCVTTCPTGTGPYYDASISVTMCIPICVPSNRQANHVFGYPSCIPSIPSSTLVSTAASTVISSTASGLQPSSTLTNRVVDVSSSSATPSVLPSTANGYTSNILSSSTGTVEQDTLASNSTSSSFPVGEIVGLSLAAVVFVAIVVGFAVGLYKYSTAPTNTKLAANAF